MNDDILEQIVIGSAREVTARFVARYGRELDNQGGGLVALFTDWIVDARGFEIAWDSSFGQIRKALLSGGPCNFDSRAAALGLRLHECGLVGQWELHLTAPTRLRIGPWLLPAADHIKVQASVKRILIQSRFQGAATPITLWRHEGSLKSDGAENLPQVAADQHKLMLLFSHALDGMEFEEVSPIVRGRGLKMVLPALESAVAVLRRHAPIYLSWVDRVVRHIVPLRTSPSIMRSASEAGQPGVIQMSFRGPSIALAEMLVHEGTHQYMNLLCQLGELDDGSDATLYYSPIRRKGRLIRWILVAYHAFANVLLFYRCCLGNGLGSDRYCRRHENRLAAQLKQLEVALRTTSALTPLGRALWEPLAAKVH